jgi:arylsulfatase A-like enzyme
MERREFLRNVSGAVVASALANGAAAQSSPATATRSAPLASGRPGAAGPNIIVLITDQTRGDVTKKAGYPLDTMPTADALATRGVDFSRAYCTTPACVPSRISMLTGRWPQAHRVRMNLQPKDAFFDKDMYQVARAQGYRTGLCGKNHTYLSAQDVDVFQDYSHEAGPKSPGASPDSGRFEEWLKHLDFNLATEPAPFPLETQFPYRIVSDAIAFMKGDAGRPFLLQVSIPEPHDPEQVPHPYWNMFPPDKLPERAVGPEAIPHLGDRAQWLDRLAKDGFPNTETLWRRYVSNYLGALRMVDDQIKRMLDFMQGHGLLENTIIVRIADHGDYLMEYGLARKGVGLSEALTHVPMSWTGPGIKPRPDSRNPPSSRSPM